MLFPHQQIAAVLKAHAFRFFLSFFFFFAPQEVFSKTQRGAPQILPSLIINLSYFRSRMRSVDVKWRPLRISTGKRMAMAEAKERNIFADLSVD